MLVVINIVILNIIITSLFSYFLAPWIKDFGEKLKILDMPDFRKIHTLPIVRIGGASIFIVFFGCLLFYQQLVNLKFENNFDFHNLYIILAGSILFFLIGLHDDKFKSPPLLRLFLQFIVAFFVSLNGFYLPPISLNFPFLGEITLQLPFLINQIFTIIWIVGITNSINWLDGIDGLASGYCSICVFGLLFATILQNNYLGIIFFSILLGSTLGFLIRNFKPAYYIMGDCGSNFLGFILSTSSIIFLQQSNESPLSIYYLIFLFSLPLGDMIFVIFNRFLKNKSIFQADRSHIHHRLLELNLKYKYVIFILYFYSILSVILGINFVRFSF